ncbi:MAG: three-Cys-motif partner protein TcmP [Rhodobacteraceae bacterium]|nr:three-Cys-motif partner protein TcmP [Paracoccaceae bacterium]
MIKSNKMTPLKGFGGNWTETKLDILEKYLNNFTTALKNQSFELWYIDAFAGYGEIEINDNETKKFIEGSVNRALKATDRPFDNLIFIETDECKVNSLKRIKRKNPSRKINIQQCDANDYLKKLDINTQNIRGVLFLDPYGTQVEWSTLERIAQYEFLDTWILFPVATLHRMMPRIIKQNSHKEKLNKVFGSSVWEDIYSSSQDLFGNDFKRREKGTLDLLNLYKKQLKQLFGYRLLNSTKSFYTSTNSHYFEFIFCTGSNQQQSINISHKIASHLINNI